MQLEVKLYGKETCSFQYLKHLILAIQERIPLHFQIAEISDIEEIITDGIEHIPSISINGAVFSFDANEHLSIESFAKKAITQLFNDTNYGNMKKILVPTDFSDCSINAFRYAKLMASSLEAMIELVHIDHPSPVAIEGALVASYYLEDEKRKKLNALAKTLTDNIGNEVMDTPIKNSYIQGLACDNLIEMSNSADVIVMGTHGKSKLLTQLLGSVSRTLVRKAKCPILLIPSAYDFRPIENIIFGYTPSLHDSENINKVIQWSQNLKARLDIVHVSRKIDTIDPTIGLQQYIDSQYPGFEYTCRIIETHDVEKGLLHVAREQEAGLIILAKQEKTLWQYLSQEHHSIEMLELTDRPILVLHQEVKKCKCGKICKKKLEDRCDH